MHLLKYIGWESCEFDDYRQQALTYGFNSESSPHYIEFLLGNGANLQFYTYSQRGAPVGACCVDNGWLCNDIKNPRAQLRDVPIPNTSILLPFAAGVRCLLPFKAKCLSQQTTSVINASYAWLSKRHAAITRPLSAYSSKTVSTRNREIRKFLAAGGSFKQIADLTCDEFTQAYGELYEKRRGKGLPFTALADAFNHRYFSNLFGYVAYLDGKPVAIQYNLSTESRAGFYVDFINIGYDTDIRAHSLGTIIMWQNLQLAESHAAALNKPLTFSFGMMSAEYKTRWCVPTPVARVIC